MSQLRPSACLGGGETRGQRLLGETKQIAAVLLLAAPQRPRGDGLPQLLSPLTVRELTRSTGTTGPVPSARVAST